MGLRNANAISVPDKAKAPTLERRRFLESQND
jgi:hypothetical protein